MPPEPTSERISKWSSLSPGASGIDLDSSAVEAAAERSAVDYQRGIPFVSKHALRTILSIATASALTVLFIATAWGQFPAESTIPKSKRGGKGRPAAKAPTGPTPRTADGKPDFSAAWGYAGVTSDIAKDYDVGELTMT